MFQTLERKHTARPERDQDQRHRLHAEFAPARKPLLKRLDRKRLCRPRLSGSLPNKAEQQAHPDQHRHPQGDQRRGQRHQLRDGCGRTLKPQHHAPPLPGRRWRSRELHRWGQSPAHPFTDHLRAAGLGHRHRAGDSRPLCDHHQPVTDFKQFVQLLTHHQHRRSRRCAARSSCAPDLRRRADIDPPGGLGDQQQLGIAASISRPTMNFCKLPPDRLNAPLPAAPPALAR